MVVTVDGKLATIKADSRVDFREVGCKCVVGGRVEGD